MSTAVRNTRSEQTLSTLDVLWAFYQSQPKRIRRAFRSRMERLDEDVVVTEPQWQQDLRGIKSLKDNWDEAAAPRINRQAIANANSLMLTLNTNTAALVRLYPTPLGAVLIKLETGKGRLKCEMGDMSMSYFVKRSDASKEHHSFETLDVVNLGRLKDHLESLV